MQGLLASAALLPPRVRQARRPSLRLAACRPCAALHAVPPPPRPPRAQPACTDVARRHSQLVCTVAAAPPAPPQPPPSLGTTLVVSLPAWLALALTAFMATFAGLCVLVIQTMLPALRDVSASAKSVQVACSGVVDACDEVEKLAVLLATDIKLAEEGISKPLQTLTRVASTFNSRTLPTQALQDLMEARRGAASTKDPDTKLLQSVAGSVRTSTEKNVRERLRKWVASLEVMRGRLQPETPPPKPPAPARPRAASDGPEQAAVKAWVGAASAVAAAESAAAKLENAIDECQTAGLCEDMDLLATAAEDAAERDADGQRPFNPS